METLCIFGVMGIIFIAYLIDKNSGKSSKSYSGSDKDEVFPNKHTYQDYEKYGFTEADMDFWGLDQPGAPEPKTAGWIVMDAMDGKIDGHIDWDFWDNSPDGFNSDAGGDFDGGFDGDAGGDFDGDFDVDFDDFDF